MKEQIATSTTINGETTYRYELKTDTGEKLTIIANSLDDVRIGRENAWQLLYGCDAPAFQP